MIVKICLLMCQHSSLWISSASTCELEVGNVIGADNAVEYVQDMVRNAFCLLHEVLVRYEIIGFPTYEAYSLQIRQGGRYILCVQLLQQRFVVEA